jgi:hypothetical protein
VGCHSFEGVGGDGNEVEMALKLSRQRLLVGESNLELTLSHTFAFACNVCVKHIQLWSVHHNLQPMTC